MNLGPTRRVAMADVRVLFTAAGLEGVASQGQSGNLVFEAPDEAGPQLEARLETVLKRGLDLATEVFVRDAKAWAAMVSANPFPEAARDIPSRLVVMALKAEPGLEAQARLDALARDGERSRIDRTWAWISYPAGISRSRVAGAALDRALGVRGTARNWNTVLKLAAMTTA